MNNLVFDLEEHKHGNHSHIKLVIGKPYTEKGGLKISDEGCPCCAAGIDLDEIATAISEIGKEGTGDGGAAGEEHGYNLAGGLADFSSASHWGIFLGISGPLAVVGLTAALRNIKGTINTRKKLNHVIDGVEKDIAKYQKEGNTSVVERLEAFKNCLKYSKFDTEFNLVVPGVINGAASGIVLSSAIWHSPWALPVIAAYAACQTGRNVYDLVRTWNRILPENLAIKPLEKSGIVKVNKITKTKRKFYSANALGFLIFTVGAVLLFLSIIGIFPPLGGVFIAGIVLLAVGALATGIMNNIWTNKFKPRNGNLGIDRKELNAFRALEQIGRRREIKKVLTKYRKQHIPYSATDSIKKFGCKILTSLPFCEQKGANYIHKMNMKKCEERNARIASATLNRQRMCLLEQMVQVIVPEFKFSQDDNNPQKVFRALKELELEGEILEKFVKNFIIKSQGDHDTSIKNLDEYKNKLLASGLFKEVAEKEHKHDHAHKHKHHHDHRKVKIEFDLEAFAKDHKAFEVFMNSIEQHLMFEYTERLRYEQYGLNDCFWELDKSKTQWKREVEPQLNIEKIKSNVQSNLGLKYTDVDTHNNSHQRNITARHGNHSCVTCAH